MAVICNFSVFFVIYLFSRCKLPGSSRISNDNYLAQTKSALQFGIISTPGYMADSVSPLVEKSACTR